MTKCLLVYTNVQSFCDTCPCIKLTIFPTLVSVGTSWFPLLNSLAQIVFQQNTKFLKLNFTRNIYYICPLAFITPVWLHQHVKPLPFKIFSKKKKYIIISLVDSSSRILFIFQNLVFISSLCYLYFSHFQTLLHFSIVSPIINNPLNSTSIPKPSCHY